MVQDGPTAEWRISSTHSVDSGTVLAKAAAGVSPPSQRRRRRDESSHIDDGGAQQPSEHEHERGHEQSTHDVNTSSPTKPQAPSSTGAAAAAAAADEEVGGGSSANANAVAMLSRDTDAGEAMLTPPKREPPVTSTSISSGESSHRRSASDSIDCGDRKPPSSPDGAMTVAAASARAADTGGDDEYNRHPTCTLRAAASDTTRPESTGLRMNRLRRQNGTEVPSTQQQLSKRTFDTKCRTKSKTNRGREEVMIPPFPMPSDEDDGAVIFQSLSSGDELDGSAFRYALNGTDQDGESSCGSSVGSESTSHSGLDDRLLDEYFPDEMGGQGTVRNAPSSARKNGAGGSNSSNTAAAGSGSAVASPHREVQKIWAGRALSNPLLRGGNSIPTLSTTQMSHSSLEEGAKLPEAGLHLLDGAPPMPLTMKSSPATRLSPLQSSRAASPSNTDKRQHESVRLASPSATVVKTTSLLELTRSVSEGSVLDHAIHRSLSQDLSSRRTCFPRAHTAPSAEEWAVCGGADKSPRQISGCCDNGTTNGDLRSLLVGYVPEFCVGTIDDDAIIVGEESSNVDNSNSIESNNTEGNNVEAARGLSPVSQLAPSPESHGSRQHRTHRTNQSSMSLGMSLWLEDVHRQHKIKEQNRSRMVAAMAKAARAHSLLVSLNSHDDSDDDNKHDLLSRSLDFDDLGQLGGFNIKRGSNVKRRTNTSDMLVTSGTNRRRIIYHNSLGRSGRVDTAMRDSAGITLDSDSDDEITDELFAERELARRARQMREEIRRAEMEELAREAERAAEAGEEKFVGAASTFDVVLAASAAVSKQTEEENVPMKSWRSGEPVPDKRRPWENMFDARPIEKIAVDLPSSPMKEWMKNALAAPPSSPMVGWVSSAIAMYDPTTPAQSRVKNENTLGKNVQHSPLRHHLASVPEPPKRGLDSYSDSYYPTTPLRRTSTLRTEATITGSSLISALSTPLSDRKRVEKVPVLQLRNIEDIVPNFGDIHLRLRTDMVGKGVQKEILGGPPSNKRRDATTSDHQSAISSDGSGSGFQHIAASLGNLLKTATFAKGQRSLTSLSDVGDGTISATSPSRRLPLPAKRPPSHPSRNSAAELSTRHIAHLSGMSLDCTRAMRAENEKDARIVLKEQLGEWSDSEGGDDDSVASHDTSSTTDLYVSALTNELHTPRSTGRKHRKLFADSPKVPPPIDDSTGIAPNVDADPLSTPDHKSRTTTVAALPIDDLTIPDAVLSVNTPMGGRRIFSRTDEGGIVESRSIEACPSQHTDDLTLPDLTYSRSHDAGYLNEGADIKTPRSANSGATSRFSDPLSERMFVAMDIVSKNNACSPKRLSRPTFSLTRTDNGTGSKCDSVIVPTASGETHNNDNESKGGTGDSVHMPAVGQEPSYSFDADTMYWDSDVDSEGSPGGLRSIPTSNSGEAALSPMYSAVYEQLGFQ